MTQITHENGTTLLLSFFKSPWGLQTHLYVVYLLSSICMSHTHTPYFKLMYSYDYNKLKIIQFEMNVIIIKVKNVLILTGDGPLEVDGLDEGWSLDHKVLLVGTR